MQRRSVLFGARPSRTACRSRSMTLTSTARGGRVPAAAPAASMSTRATSDPARCTPTASARGTPRERRKQPPFSQRTRPSARCRAGRPTCGSRVCFAAVSPISRRCHSNGTRPLLTCTSAATSCRSMALSPSPRAPLLLTPSPTSRRAPVSTSLFWPLAMQVIQTRQMSSFSPWHHPRRRRRQRARTRLHHLAACLRRCICQLAGRCQLRLA